MIMGYNKCEFGEPAEESKTRESNPPGYKSKSSESTEQNSAGNLGFPLI